jgi:hypothetical protein
MEPTVGEKGNDLGEVLGQGDPTGRGSASPAKLPGGIDKLGGGPGGIDKLADGPGLDKLPGGPNGSDKLEGGPGGAKPTGAGR